jgi:exopolysaccharide biosynthesis polyprenyl glycosylphosphotransferase
MAGHDSSLLRPSNGSVDVLEAEYTGTTRPEIRELHPTESADSSESSAAQGADASPSWGHSDLAGEDPRDAPTPATTETIPTRNRFAAWSRRYLIGLASADAIVGGAATAIPASISNTLSGWPYAVVVLGLVGMVVWPLAIGLRQGYRRGRIGVGLDELRAVTRAGMFVVVASALPTGFVAVPRGELALHALLKLIVVAAPFAVLLSLVVRFLARHFLRHLQNRGTSLRNVLVVGGFDAAQHLSERIRREPYCGMKVVGVCLPSAELPRPVVDGIPVLGSLAQVADVVRSLGCDAVAVTSDDATRFTYLRELAWSLEGAGVELLVDPGLFEVAGPRMHIRPLMGFPLVHVEEPHFEGWRRIVKRLTDVVMASIGLVMISPLLLAIAAMVKLQDGGPVIFRQTRIGRGGKPFTMFKFRSMVVDAEEQKPDLLTHNEAKGVLFKLTRDPRVTRLGQFLRDYSLDELPQLLNVLGGSMSLVGPRPHLADEVARMPSQAVRRSLVTPGLTGLWQVSGRSELEGDDAIRLDLRYVENWSFTLDLLILWKTISAVLARRGAA